MGQIGFIIDLDMTLFDTSMLELDRDRGNWENVFKNIEKVVPLVNPEALFWGIGLPKLTEGWDLGLGGDYLYPYKDNVSIVTSSPKEYAKKILSNTYSGLIDYLIAFQDTVKHKPNPDPFILAIDKMGLDTNKDLIITIGDSVSDIKASKSLGNNLVDYSISAKGRHVEGLSLELTPGVYNVGVSSGDYTSEELSAAGASTVYKSIEDFLIDFSIFNDLYCETNIIPKFNVKEKSGVPNIDKIYSLSYYFSSKTGYFDKTSNNILKFKDGNKSIIEKWAFYLRECIRSIGLDDELKDYNILRPLGHDELVSRGDEPLDFLISDLSDSFKCKEVQELIGKNNENKPLKLLGGREKRRAEIENNYYINKNIKISKSNFIILDDVMTTGTTLEVIAKKIKSQYPKGKIIAITLAETSYIQQGGPKYNHDYLELKYTSAKRKKKVCHKRKFSKIDMKNGFIYIGETEKNNTIPHGYGRIVQSSPRLSYYEYIGQWKNGKKHGRGHERKTINSDLVNIVYRNDSVLDGLGTSVKKTEYGEIIETYYGDHYDGKRTGLGVMMTQLGMFRGIFEDDMLNGLVCVRLFGEWTKNGIMDAKFFTRFESDMVADDIYCFIDDSCNGKYNRFYKINYREEFKKYDFSDFKFQIEYESGDTYRGQDLPRVKSEIPEEVGLICYRKCGYGEFSTTEFRYKGNWEHGCRYGYGEMTLYFDFNRPIHANFANQNSIKLCGTWSSDMIQGEGEIHFGPKFLYKGSFWDNWFDGEGLITISDKKLKVHFKDIIKGVMSYDSVNQFVRESLSNVQGLINKDEYYCIVDFVYIFKILINGNLADKNRAEDDDIGPIIQMINATFEGKIKPYAVATKEPQNISNIEEMKEEVREIIEGDYSLNSQSYSQSYLDFIDLEENWSDMNKDNCDKGNQLHKFYQFRLENNSRESN